MGYLLAAFALATGVASADGEFKVRLLNDRDIPEIVSIQRQHGQTDASQTKLATQLEGTRTGCTVVVYDHRVVGFILTHDLETELHAQVGVSTDYPAPGAWDALVDALKKLVEPKQGKPFDRAVIELPSENKQERDALLKRGFLVESAGEKTVVTYQRASRLTMKQLEPLDYYERAGVPKGADEQTVRLGIERRKAANRRSPAVLKLLDDAARTLLDPQKKERYDEQLGILIPSGMPTGHAAPGGRRVLPFSPDLYERLGVPANSSQREIENAYFRASWLVRKSPRALAFIEEAFAVLGRKDLRGRYDGLRKGGAVATDAVQKFLRNAPKTIPDTAQRYGYNPLAIDPYEVLGVSRTATKNDIDQAFERIRRELPAVKYGTNPVVKAHHVLSTPKLRSYYDEHAAKLSSPEQRALIDEMYLDEGRFPATPQRASNASPFPKPPTPYEFFYPHDWDLYRELGADADADSEKLRQAYEKTMEQARKTSALHVPQLEEIHQVLSDPDLKRKYDSLRAQLIEDNDPDRNYHVGRFLALARMALAVKEAHDPSDLKRLIERSRRGLKASKTAPLLAKQYLDTVQSLYLKARESGKALPDLAFLDDLAEISTRLDAKDHPEIRSKELELRALVVRDLLQRRHDGKGIDSLLGRYLKTRPPDFLADEIRTKRDALTRPPAAQPEPSPAADACDAFARLRK